MRLAEDFNAYRSSEKCQQIGLSRAEIYEALGIATRTGGTIVIPDHLKAFDYWEELGNV